MKKKIVYFLVGAMVLSLAACGSQTGQGNASQETTQESSQESSVEESTQESTQEVSQESSEEESQESEQQGSEEGAMGQALAADFLERAADGETADLQQLADNLLMNPVCDFMGGTMPMEPGYLSGFSKEIDGFEEAVMFSPMIGSIPFVGYVFNLAEDSDVDAFVQNLKDNADPRWNICTEAHEMVVETSGNTVFFVMCP